MYRAYLYYSNHSSDSYCDSDDSDGFVDFDDFDDSDSFCMVLNSYTWSRKIKSKRIINNNVDFNIESLLLQNATFRRKLTPVDLAEVNFSVCDAYYYSYSYFCEDSFDYVAEVVVAYPMVADPTVAVAAVASDCISLHWNVSTNIYLACDQVSF